MIKVVCETAEVPDFMDRPWVNLGWVPDLGPIGHFQHPCGDGRLVARLANVVLVFPGHGQRRLYLGSCESCRRMFYAWPARFRVEPL